MNNGDTPASALTGDAYTNFAAHDDSNMTSYDPQCQGLTKREHFAGLAMQAMISSRWYGDFCNESSSYNNQQAISELAVSQADELLAELEK